MPISTRMASRVETLDNQQSWRLPKSSRSGSAASCWRRNRRPRGANARPHRPLPNAQNPDRSTRVNRDGFPSARNARGAACGPAAPPATGGRPWHPGPIGLIYWWYPTAGGPMPAERDLHRRRWPGAVTRRASCRSFGLTDVVLSRSGQALDRFKTFAGVRDNLRERGASIRMRAEAALRNGGRADRGVVWALR